MNVENNIVDLMTMAKPRLDLRSKVLDKLQLQEYRFLDCFQCLKCTSGCTSLKLLELKPHEIVGLVKLGFIEELVASDVIWACATCLKCKERCPQKATPYDVILALRNLAVEQEAKVPENYLKAVSQILDNGLIQSPQKVTTRELETFSREDLGLHKIVFPSESFKTVFLKALEEH